MKYIVFFFFLLFASCVSVNDSNIVYKDVLCDVIGDGYKYESYVEFCQRIGTYEIDDEFFKKNRREKEQPVFLFDSTYGPGYNSSFVTYVKFSRAELGLYKELIEDSIKGGIDIEGINNGNGYTFKSINDESIKFIKPSSRVVFSLSKVIFSTDKKSMFCR